MEIKAEIVAHSKSSVNGKEIVTFSLEYPRFIHSELMTHRLFSRNAASSRAIPVAKMIDQVRNDPAMPVHWGKNQSGMQAKEELSGVNKIDVMGEWQLAAMNAADSAQFMADEGAHKQIVNRILEPFQMMKTVLTATEFDNFFWLRKHPDAQPEIKLLAEKMWEALEVSEAVELEPGEWHVPYVKVIRDSYGSLYYVTEYDGVPHDHTIRVGSKVYEPITLEDALAISSSCCAQVSYRKLDDSLEKAKDIFGKLIESKPCHASPTEHQATPMEYTTASDGCWWVEGEGRMVGVTHADRDGQLWSGNFKSWIQHRQIIPENVCWNFEE